ncbi:CAP domain-containing protein [Patulibacter sp. NPDC049589]|uniref:CAP domain-containing protein n=1 Tax=Patulibacter sp. NPDC049589 TaxID=3154731 RepID=UPI0034129A05
MSAPWSGASGGPSRARRPRPAGVAFVAAAAVAAALATAPGATAATSCPDADLPVALSSPDRAVAAVGCLVNHERESVGLQPVALDARARQAAQGHADDMAARNYFDHTAPVPAPNGTTVAERLTATGYSWSSVGENIARGQLTPRLVMQAWLGSEIHCTNLMAPKFTDAGFGVSTAGAGPYWVQVFARPLGTPEPHGPAITCPKLPAIPAPSGAGTGTGTGTGTGAGTSTGTGTTTGAGAGAKKAKATAKRTRRRLTVTLTLPAGSGKATVVLRITQRKQARRTVRFRLTRGKVHRLRVTLAKAANGRVAVTAGSASLAARFR